MALPPGFGSPPTEHIEDVHAALQHLQTVETCLLVKDIDITYAATIRRASSAIVYALRELATPDSSDRDDLIQVFKEITSECFLSKLLGYRREILHVGVLSASIKGAIVSWIDVILAHIAMTTVCIASDTADMDGMEGTLGRQKEDEAIRAASQLPYTWAEMLGLLTSNMASCTVLRLSLRLTFAAYILHPQLSGINPPLVDTFVSNVIRTYLSRVLSTEFVIPEYNGDGTPFARKSRDRIAFAMILGLCSVAKQFHYSAGQTPREFPYVFPPEVLYLIHAIVHPDPGVPLGTALLRFARPDGAQVVLLCWGQVVPWSWTVWNDTRLPDIDLITQLTAAWICHADTLCLRKRWMRRHNWRRLLLRAAKSRPFDAATVVTQLLNHIVNVSSHQELESTSAIRSSLLLRACWLAAQLLNPCHPWHATATPTLIRSMCCIVVECKVEGVSLDALESLVEALTHIDMDELQAVIQTLQDDKQSQFLSMLENTIKALESEVSSAAKARAPLTSTMTRTICLIMNFLTLCCNASPHLCYDVSISAFLSAVTIYASKFDTSALCSHLLTAISSVGGSRKDIPRNSMEFDKIPWELALSGPRSDILMASCLASCVLAREHLASLHTSTAVEIWDYLRDVLLLILTGHYTGDELPLSFLVAPTLCKALRALLCQTSKPLVTWALYSPWAKDLCTVLRALLQGDEDMFSKRDIILKRRLSTAGGELVQSLEDGNVGEEVEEEPKGRMECVYFKGQIVKVVRKE